MGNDWKIGIGEGLKSGVEAWSNAKLLKLKEQAEKLAGEKAQREYELDLKRYELDKWKVEKDAEMDENDYQLQLMKIQNKLLKGSGGGTTAGGTPVGSIGAMDKVSAFLSDYNMTLEKLQNKKGERTPTYTNLEAEYIRILNKYNAAVSEGRNPHSLLDANEERILEIFPEISKALGEYNPETNITAGETEMKRSPSGGVLEKGEMELKKKETFAGKAEAGRTDKTQIKKGDNPKEKFLSRKAEIKSKQDLYRIADELGVNRDDAIAWYNE